MLRSEFIPNFPCQKSNVILVFQRHLRLPHWWLLTVAEREPVLSALGLQLYCTLLQFSQFSFVISFSFKLLFTFTAFHQTINSYSYLETNRCHSVPCRRGCTVTLQKLWRPTTQADHSVWGSRTGGAGLLHEPDPSLSHQNSNIWISSEPQCFLENFRPLARSDMLWGSCSFSLHE